MFRRFKILAALLAIVSLAARSEEHGQCQPEEEGAEDQGGEMGHHQRGAPVPPTGRRH